jgi:hypothetical protein
VSGGAHPHGDCVECRRRDEAVSKLRECLLALADAAETFAGSEPDMPSHADTETEFDIALGCARAALGMYR